MYVQELKSLFDAAQITLAVAESASGGRLSAFVTSVSGASSFFQGGVVAYNLRQKVELLAVDSEHAARVNCVSDRVAMEMATGIRRVTGADVGISVTGYAEPTSRGELFAWIGFDVCGIVWAVRVDAEIVDYLDTEDHRVQTQDEYAVMAVEVLLEFFDQLQTGPSPVTDHLLEVACRLRGQG